MRYTTYERTSALYTATLTDETGVAVAGSTLTTATLTLYDVDTGVVLNSRNAQNVLNANGVTIDANGLVSWTLAPEDNVIQNDQKATEVHRAVFRFTWSSGAKGCMHPVELDVENVR